MKPNFRSITYPSPAARGGLGPISQHSWFELDCELPPRTEHHAEAIARLASRNAADLARARAVRELQVRLDDIARGL